MKTRPRKLQDPKKVQKIVDKYFKDCQENKIIIQVWRKGEFRDKTVERPRTMAGLCVALDIGADTLLNYVKLDDDVKDDENLTEISLILTRARVKIQTWLLEMGVIGAVESKITGLALSSDHGMAEKSEVKGTGTLNITTSQYVPKEGASD